MRLRVFALMVGLFALTIGAQVPRTQTQVEIPQAVTDRVAAGESVPVIVGVQMAFRPEGELAGPAGVTLQRSAIARALDDVTDRVASAGIDVGARFQYIPFFTARVDGAAELAELASMPGVLSVEEDDLARPSLAQSVPLIGANTSHTAGFTGNGWAVAILDTGVLSSHPFFGGRVVGAAESCFSNGGGSGTSVCPGGATTATGPGAGAPCLGSISGCDHGTHVAGIAAGANGQGGINGVAPGASIIAMQVFTRFDGASNCGSQSPCISSFNSDTALALERVFTLAGAGNVNKVASVNMSLGGSTKFTSNCDSVNTARKAAIDNLRSIGIATAIASGNDGDDGIPGISSPGCISTAVSVGSTTKTDTVSSFSNYASILSVMAPGSSITASVLNNGYGVKSGTSMATPHVAGAWAVLKQASPAASVLQVLQALQTTGQAINDVRLDPPGETVQAFFPRIAVNAARLALGGGGGTGAPGAPGQPVGVVSGNNVTINWGAPTTGGAPTHYLIVAGSSAGASNLGTFNVGNTLTISVPGLPNGSYFLRLHAVNATGQSPASLEGSFTIGPVPTPPGIPSTPAVSVSGSTVSISWTPGAGGTPSHYLIHAGSTSGSTNLGIHNVGPGTSLQVTLGNGVYFIRIQAVNQFGSSGLSGEASWNIGATAAPGVPGTPTASVVGSQVTLNWTPPGTGGAPTFYIIVAGNTPGGSQYGQFNVGLVNTITVPGLGNGTYYIRLIAANGLGQSAATPEMSFTIAGPGSTGTDGTWNGMSSGGIAVEFIIQNGQVTTLGGGGAVSGSCTATTRRSGGTFGSVNGSSISASFGSTSSSVGVNLTGTLSGGSGSGTMAVTGYSGCSGSTTVTWTAVNSGVGAPLIPSAPFGFSNSSVSGTTANFSWFAPFSSDVVSQYELELGTSSGGSEIGVFTFAAPTTTYQRTGLAPGSYFARLRARNSSGRSPASTQASFTIANPYAGNWFGSTADGRTMSFIINTAGTSLTTFVSGTILCNPGSISNFASRPLTANAFNWSDTSGALSYTVTGTMTSPTAANGTLQVSQSGCPTYNTTWTAGR